MVTAPHWLHILLLNPKLHSWVINNSLSFFCCQLPCPPLRLQLSPIAPKPPFLTSMSLPWTRMINKSMHFKLFWIPFFGFNFLCFRGERSVNCHSHLDLKGKSPLLAGVPLLKLFIQLTQRPLMAAAVNTELGAASANANARGGGFFTALFKPLDFNVSIIRMFKVHMHRLCSALLLKWHCSWAGPL